MSTRAVRWAVAADFTLSAPEQLVLILVAHHYSEQTRACWPSHALLARESKLSPSSVDRALTALVQKGLIRRTAGNKGYSTRYTLPRYVESETAGTPTVGVVDPGGTPTQGEGTPTVGVTTPSVGVEHKETTNRSNRQKIREEQALAKVTPESPMKVSEIQAKFSSQYAGLSDEQITAVKRVAGRFTAAGLARCWTQAHGKYAGSFLATLTIKDRGTFATAYKRVGDVLPHAILAVLKDWSGFVAHCKQAAGAFTVPSQPSIPFFIKYVETAVDFLGKGQAEAEAAPVQLIAKPKQKPKPAPASTAPVSKLDPEDLKAALADLENDG